MECCSALKKENHAICSNIDEPGRKGKNQEWGVTLHPVVPSECKEYALTAYLHSMDDIKITKTDPPAPGWTAIGCTPPGRSSV